MPEMKGNRIGIMVYLLPDTYRALQDMRNPHLSASAHCAMILDEVAGVAKE